MYVVGSDRIAVDGDFALPAGRLHAVSPDGRALCRPTRARFTWPDRSWGEETEDASETCPLCSYVLAAQDTFAFVPAQPGETAPASAEVVAYPAEPAPPSAPVVEAPVVEALVTEGTPLAEDAPIWW